ncbi:MAG: LEA type 2 family protein [Myxococcota bacterium]
MITLLLAGCTGDLSPYLPTVTFERFDVKDLDFEHIEVDFVFDVHNPNPVDVPLSRFDYALAFEEIELLSGDNPEGLQLTAEGSSELALPLDLEFANILEIAEAARGEDAVGYGLAGGFGFDTDLGPVDIAYAEDGDFPALRTPKFTLGQLRLGDLNGDSVDLTLDVDVDNDHGSSLLFQNLDFDMKFAGVRVGGGVVEELGEVPGATSQTFQIPFSVDYADALEAAAVAASGGKMRVDLAADMDVDTPFGPVPLSVDENGDVSVRQTE